MAFRVTRALRAASGKVPVHEKYTQQSTGIWERIRRTLAVAPERSNGIPLNRQFRNPPPGALDPNMYDDPVTLPAGDIADNPYWKRDTRRGYARQSVITQSDAVGLLTVGNQIAPKQLGVGEAGEKQLIQAKKEGEERGLAGFFEGAGGATSVLGENGLPPLPTGQNVAGAKGQKDYVMNPESEQAYPKEYPCRTFV